MRRRLFSLAALFALGCGSSASVSGNITYNGSAVADGYITFFPTGPGAKEVAAPIKDGKYQLTLPPGPRLVEIVSSGAAAGPISSADLEAKARENKSKTAPPPAAERIPDNAVGNRQTIEIVAGTHTLDFHLKKP